MRSAVLLVGVLLFLRRKTIGGIGEELGGGLDGDGLDQNISHTCVNSQAVKQDSSLSERNQETISQGAARTVLEEMAGEVQPAMSFAFVTG